MYGVMSSIQQHYQQISCYSFIFPSHFTAFLIVTVFAAPNLKTFTWDFTKFSVDGYAWDTFQQSDEDFV